MTKVDYQKGMPSERFIHYYAYDADGRLTNVQTSRDDINKVQQASYYYYLHGPLKRVELGDHLQGIDYVYTSQGWLKTINTPTGVNTNDPGQDGVSNGFAKDAFGMQIEYFPGDYSRNNNTITSVSTGLPTYYNGNVNGISWQSNKPSSALTNNPNIQQPNMYTYSYDEKYQLKGATWGTPSFTGSPFSPQTMFKEQVSGYDANGNITGLQRTNGSGAVMDNDNFSKYSYQAGTNQLLGVGTSASSTAYAGYTYDEIGRLKSETLTGAPNPYYLQYDVTGKITGIYSDASLSAQYLKESYSYDESGNRIKTVNSTGTTYYVYDASGNVMAIYNGTTSPTIAEVPFYGSDRLGTYFYSSSNYQYELRDNVSSVRVVMNRTKNSNGQADIVTYNDYYPFGSIAQSVTSGYRYDYQGAYSEKDSYTGWNNFQLRMYDGKVGRWLTTDPAGQFSSPYAGMGNNPVMGRDPTGGSDTTFVDANTGKSTISSNTPMNVTLFGHWTPGSLVFNYDPSKTQHAPNPNYVADQGGGSTYDASNSLASTFWKYGYHLDNLLQGSSQTQPGGYILFSATGNGESFRNGDRAKYVYGDINMDDIGSLANGADLARPGPVNPFSSFQFIKDTYDKLYEAFGGSAKLKPAMWVPDTNVLYIDAIMHDTVNVNTAINRSRLGSDVINRDRFPTYIVRPDLK